MSNDFDKVNWEWLCSLHRTNHEKLQVDPKKRTCHCGFEWYFSKFQYMKMILFDGITITCPRCQRKHRFKLSYHAIEEFNETRIENNELIEKRKLSWNHP